MAYSKTKLEKQAIDAIELSENYCAVILERMATAFPEIEIKKLENAKRAN